MWDTTALNLRVFSSQPGTSYRFGNPVRRRRTGMSTTSALPVRISQSATMLIFLFLSSLNSPRILAQIPGADIPPQPPTTVTKTDEGMTATIGDETLRIAVCGESVIHVTASPKPLSQVVRGQPWMLDSRQACPGAPFQFNQARNVSILTTRTLRSSSIRRGAISPTLALTEICCSAKETPYLAPTNQPR
jgi:hypothetical protein